IEQAAVEIQAKDAGVSLNSDQNLSVEKAAPIPIPQADFTPQIQATPTPIDAAPATQADASSAPIDDVPTPQSNVSSVYADIVPVP
ncbi:unnamed protein product, partial [Ilex paraguariensis]